ncbi:PKD domain-containing protein [Ulvibacterium sp.]|uniref:PKD domain-containing protein n=1 Tax=Ulvibacterium sp. TaxID=2665914 RepID=UPI002603B484|nr:PKD domain-containing protein [Ulvibacterium sp.]
MKTQNYFCFIFALTLALTSCSIQAQITLNQNIGETTGECSPSNEPGISYGRAFVLEDFGITENDQLILDSVEIAFRQWYGQNALGMIRINVYEIDGDFPKSFDPAKLIGSSQDVTLTEMPSPFTKPTPLQKLQINFDAPVIIPSLIKKVFIEVTPLVSEGHFLQAAFTKGETDSAYFKDYATSEYTMAVSQREISPNYYLKAFGTLNRISDYRINYISACSDLSASFDLTDSQQIATVAWDFGDPDSAEDNNSTDLNPDHEFSSGGTYTITAKITTKAWREVKVTTTLSVTDSITVYPVDDLFAFETTTDTGTSYAFDTSLVESTILGGQSGLVVSYFDEKGNPLPSHMSNLDVGTETITARVARPKDPGCYKEVAFNLIVQSPSLALSSQEPVGLKR